MPFRTDDASPVVAVPSGFPPASRDRIFQLARDLHSLAVQHWARLQPPAPWTMCASLKFTAVDCQNRQQWTGRSKFKG